MRSQSVMMARGIRSDWLLINVSRVTVSNKTKIDLLQLLMGRPVGDHGSLLDLVGRCSHSPKDAPTPGAAIIRARYV